MERWKPGRIVWVALVATLGAGPIDLRGADRADSPAVPPAGIETTELASTRVHRVEGWLRRLAPECASRLNAAAAERFLNKLRENQPAFFEQLPATEDPPPEIRSLLLQFAGSLLAKDGAEPVREAIAGRRVALFAAVADPRPAVAALKKDDPDKYRRLLDGKMDDDELSLALARGTGPGVRPKVSAPPTPAELTASDIAAEYARHNQAGSALTHLSAYKVEATLQPASGAAQHLLIFRLRPNRFRLLLLEDGATRYVLAGDGQKFWQQSRGGPPAEIGPDAIGRRRYLAEFTGPLFFPEENSLERLDDGVLAGRKTYRIAFNRPDGTHGVSWIDPGTYREVEREEQDGYRTRYADFREVAGVIFPFRQEVTDSTGRTGLLQIARVVPNPGLTSELFTLATGADAGPDSFRIEQLWSAPRPAGPKP